MSEEHVRKDRLEDLKEKVSRAKVYYSVPNSRSDYQMDISDARDDFRWMIYEIERLRAELAKKPARGGAGS